VVHRRWGLKAVVLGIDLAALVVAMSCAALASELVRFGAVGAVERSSLALGAVSLPAWLLALARSGLYRTRFVTGRLCEFQRLVRAVVYGTVGTATLAFAFDIDAPRSWLAILFATSLVALTIGRSVVRAGISTRRRNGQLLRRVLVVGGNAEALALSGTLVADRTHGYEVVGFLSDHPVDGELTDIPVLGPIADALAIVRLTGVSSVMIATTAVDSFTSNRLARELADAGVHVELTSSLRDIATRRLSMRPLGRYPIVYLEPICRSGWRALAKRSFDVALSGTALVATLPLLLLTALAIRLDSSGPVLFRQRRVGKDGQTFSVLKFRTMVADAEARIVDLRAHNEVDGPLFKMRNDPRVTRLGRLLRKLSIDEVPQLWNVLRGEMSLVGPRPALPSEVESWHADLHGRLRVKPGITGMWQVSGRSNSSFEDYVRLDLYYVDNWSLATDLGIVLRTIPTVMFSRGAY
jgi:exopolysaccharide biosynthesis polyprenyl glycosylphosphotransferase